MNPYNWIVSCVHEVLLRRRFPTSVIHKGAYVSQGSVLGDHTVLFSDVALIESSVGAYSYIQTKSVICNSSIGRFCSIAGNVYIGLANHPTQMVSTSPVFYDNNQPLPKFFIRKPIFDQTLPQSMIGADVWVGQGVLIKAGVSIGVGAVIGAGSVVTKDVPPYVIAAGNPCKTIRPRFEEDIVHRLLLSKWWMLDEEILMKHAPNFGNVELFLSKLSSDVCSSVSLEIQRDDKHLQ